jgi:uncharacterized membrane protein
VAQWPAAKAFVTLSIAAIVLGAFFRFHNLDRKLFWQDEVYTALRVSGHLERDYRTNFDGRMHSESEVLAFTELDRRTSDAFPARALAREDPHHAPLFYLLERLAIDIAGSSIAAYRILPAIFGCAGIVCAFFLGRRLFASTLGGFTLASLIATAPFFILYSMQAREYALLTDITLLATLAFLRARESRSTYDWLPYAALATLGLYTDPLFALTLAAHGAIVLVLDRRSAFVMTRFAGSALTAAILFTPWIVNALSARANISGQLLWGNTKYPLSYFAAKWAFNAAALFFDYEFRDQHFIWIAVLLFAFVLTAVIYTATKVRGIVRAVALAMPAVTIGAFLIGDAVGHSHYSTIARYVMPAWIGIECAVAATIVAGLSSQNPARRRWALAGYAVLLACGIGSAAGRDGAPNWWDNNNEIAYQDVAAVINREPRPLVISEGHWYVPLVLSRYLRPDAAFLLVGHNLKFSLPRALPNAFIVAPTAAMRTALERSRPGLRLENVSPNTATLITRVHRDVPSTIRDSAAWESPQNALWQLRAANEPR